jgi:hypothetical protein
MVFAGLSGDLAQLDDRNPEPSSRRHAITGHAWDLIWPGLGFQLFQDFLSGWHEFYLCSVTELE